MQSSQRPWAWSPLNATLVQQLIHPHKGKWVLLLLLIFMDFWLHCLVLMFSFFLWLTSRQATALLIMVATLPVWQFQFRIFDTYVPTTSHLWCFALWLSSILPHGHALLIMMATLPCVTVSLRIFHAFHYGWVVPCLHGHLLFMLLFQCGIMTFAFST
jgi:hypothetical protein